MKTTKQVCEYLPATLVRSVVRQIGGKDYLRDVAEHGASGGFPGFTYYRDTVAFFKRHRADIVALVERMADDLGESPVEMVAGFGCIGGHAARSDYDWQGNMTSERRNALREHFPSVSRCLYGGRLTDEDTTVANGLAWFALEEVARAFCDD